MAKKSPETQKSPAPAQTSTKRNTAPIEVSTISMTQGAEIPDIVKSSKYPWDKLADAEPRSVGFEVPADDKEDAERIRSVVYSSGRNYFLKRKKNLIPIVRMFERDGNWFVGAWAGLENK